MQTEPILTETIASIQDILGAELDRITVEHLTTARRLYRTAAADNLSLVVLLCQGARIFARSDRPDTMLELASCALPAAKT